MFQRLSFKAISFLLFFSCGVQALLYSQEDSQSKVREFFVPTSLTAIQKNKIEALNRLVAAERLYQARELLSREKSLSQEVKSDLLKITMKDFIKYFETSSLAEASEGAGLRKAIDKLADQTAGHDVVLPTDKPRDFLLDKVLLMGLNFEAPLVQQAEKIKPLSHLVQEKQLFSESMAQWNQDFIKILQNPMLRKPLLDYEFYLSENQGLSLFWASRLGKVDLLTLQQGTPAGLLAFFKDKASGKILARLDTIDSNYNPIYLFEGEGEDGESSLGYVISEVGASDRELHFSLAWALAGDAVVDESENPNLEEAFKSQVVALNTYNHDGEWYSILNKLIAQKADPEIPETWIIGQLGLFDRFFSREDSRRALKAALARGALTWNQLALEANDLQKVQALIDESVNGINYFEAMFGEAGKLVDQLASKNEIAKIIVDDFKTSRIQKIDLRTYNWALYEFVNEAGKAFRIRVFENCWGDELSPIMDQAYSIKPKVFFLGTAGGIPGSVDVKRNDLIAPTKYKKITMQNWNPEVPPQPFVVEHPFTPINLPGLNFKTVESITSVSTPFTETNEWFEFQKENNIQLVDVESGALTGATSEETQLSALYFVSDIVGSEHESLSEDDSSGRADMRVQAASHILMSLGVEAASYSAPQETSKNILIQQALETELPKKAGAIDRRNVLQELLPALEFQDENFVISAEWLKSEVKKISRATPAVDDDSYFEYAVKVAQIIRSISAAISEKEIWGFEFYVSKSFYDYKADTTKALNVKVCTYNPSAEGTTRNFEIVNELIQNLQDSVKEYVVFELLTNESCQRFSSSHDALSGFDSWDSKIQMRQRLMSEVGFIYLSQANGLEKIHQTTIPLKTLFGPWIQKGAASSYAKLFSLNADEKEKIKNIGPVNSLHSKLVEIKDQLNNSISGEFDHDLEVSVSRSRPVELKLERVSAGLEQWQFVPQKVAGKGLVVSLQLDGRATALNFQYAELYSFLGMLTGGLGDDNRHNYSHNTGELLELLLNAEQGSAKAQYYIANEYEAGIKYLQDHLGAVISTLNPEQIRAANEYLDLRLARIVDYRKKIETNFEKEKSYRKGIAELRLSYLRSLEEKRSQLAAAQSPELINYEPIELAKQGKRKELVSLFSANLPWEDFEPTEMRYWKRALELLENPMPLEQRTLFFRGLSGDAKTKMVKKYGDGTYALLPSGWGRGQGSYLLALRYLKKFYDKLNRRDEASLDPVNPITYSKWFKDLRLLNTGTTRHSEEPRGSPYLSTSNFQVAWAFSTEVDQNGLVVDSPTAIAAILADPRVHLPNFVSSFTSEYEYLASLIVMPQDILHMFTTQELNAFKRDQTGAFDYAAVNQFLQEKLNAKGISKTITEDDLKLVPRPDQMAEAWWDLISQTGQLSPEKFAESLKSGLPDSLTRNVNAVIYTPVSKD